MTQNDQQHIVLGIDINDNCGLAGDSLHLSHMI